MADALETTITGTPGVENTLTGTSTDETIAGAGLSDTLSGGGGDDTITGQSGHDQMFGNGGNDALYGGNGNDSLNGNNGHDDLDGGRGEDTLYGGNGNDRLYGNEGTDTLYGGNGNDSFVIDGSLAGLSVDTIADFDVGRVFHKQTFTDGIELYNVGGQDVRVSQVGDDVELYIGEQLMAIFEGSEGALSAFELIGLITVVGEDPHMMYLDYGFIG